MQQEAVQKLNEAGSTVEQDKKTYGDLKSKVVSIESEITQQISCKEFTRITIFKDSVYANSMRKIT